MVVSHESVFETSKPVSLLPPKIIPEAQFALNPTLTFLEYPRLTTSPIKKEAGTAPIMVRSWGRVINLSSECDCQPCTVRRVIWPGIARGLGDDVKVDDVDKDGKVRFIEKCCEKRRRLPAGGECLTGKEGVVNEVEGPTF